MYLYTEIFYDFSGFFQEQSYSLGKFKYDMAFGFLPRNFMKGDVIYNEDDEVEELYLIKEGTVIG